MTRDGLHALEERRLKMQAMLDAGKSQSERNRLGQFATPPALAAAIMSQATTLQNANRPVRFLDPALGTGAFMSALLRTFPRDQIELVRGYEIDRHYGEPAQQLWHDSRVDVVIDDFTAVIPPVEEHDRFNLIVCNPPYVRHHHLTQDTKKRLQAQVSQRLGMKVSGLAGLYAYFMLLVDAWLQNDGIAGWLIPSEFMDVNYGRALRHYLMSRGTLLMIHRFDPEDRQFDDALVSSVVVWFRKTAPHTGHTARFSLGGSLEQPSMMQFINRESLSDEGKWTRFPNQRAQPIFTMQPRLSDLFDIKRGIATGANQFFIVTAEKARHHALPSKFLTPILPSPRYLQMDEVLANANGEPLTQPLQFLIDCDLPEAQIASHYPTLWAYLQLGIAQGVHKGYLCRHRARWYAQDQRAPAPFLCTYMGRPISGRAENPFRFLINHSRAVAPNVYLNLYPKPPLARAIADNPDHKLTIWRSLQRIPIEMLVNEGRSYGGGLYKLEPKELGNLPTAQIFDDSIMELVQSPQQIALF